MQEQIPYITLIEAPYGYGKTFHVDKLIKKYQFLNITYIHQNDNFINSLIKSFNINKFECPISSDFLDWLKYFKHLKYNLLITIDNIDKIEDSKSIDFINFFIKNKCPNIHFIITSSTSLELIENINLSDNCNYLSQHELLIQEDEFKNIWAENKIKISKSDIDFFNKSKGWALVLQLYLKLKKNIIDINSFNKSLLQAHEILFEGIENIFSETNEKYIKSKLINKHLLSHLNFDYLMQTNKQYSDYWLYLSLNRSKSVEESIIYLQRALKISLSQKHYNQVLKIYNRLINFYTLNADYKNIDISIEEGFKYIDFSSISDISVYKYLKSNRLRQQSKYNEALELLKQNINLINHESIFLKFNTKSIVLYGLIQYQIGNYDLTKEYYKQALFLSENEGNKVLNLEIEIMSAFLDAWEGKDNKRLDNSIIEIVESFPLKDQPMMWLNLAFYWVLGEKINIEYVELILNKIELINEVLKFNFLIPLIADIKARVLRFKGEYESAFYYHKVALDNLENNSFEYIHAKLNMALSLIKISNNKEAEILINEVYHQSLKYNSLGLAKEAEILLKQIDSDKYSKKLSLEVNSNHNKKIIENIIDEKDNNIRFEFFGNFNGYINNEIVKWNRKKAKNLIIKLILSSGGIHREHLAELLFPDDDNPIKNLDVHIHLIRKIFDKRTKNDKSVNTKNSSIIIFQNSSYFINKNFTFRSDIDDFNKKYNKWKSELSDEAKYLLGEELINIYKDGFLSDIDFFDSWEPEREDYRLKTIEILVYLCKNNTKNNIEYFCQKLISIDPYRDENYILTMNKIYDNKNLLRSVFKKYSQIMEDDLLIKPNQSVVNLYNELLKK